MSKKKKPDPYLIDEDNPEWTEEMFKNSRPARDVLIEIWGKEKAEAFLAENKKHIAARRGRPKKANPKVPTHIRLDRDVKRFFASTGKGWQTRINAALREWITAHQDCHP